MKRRHLFEFHERNECPGFIRDSVVEALGRGLRWGKFDDAMGPPFEIFLKTTGATQVLDLCSGSGEPAADLVRWIKSKGGSLPRFMLSDLFPNLSTLEATRNQEPEALFFCPDPVDALKVPPEIDHDARMLVNAFHHFDTDKAKQILQACSSDNKSIFIFECSARGWSNLMRLALSLPSVPLAIMANPFLARRQKFLKFIFTYLCPIIPFVFAWDSITTNLRTYSEPEWKTLTKSFTGYQWTYQEHSFGRGARAVACYGIPIEKSENNPTQTENSRKSPA
jgi:SAM-dependent methyltransferase